MASTNTTFVDYRSPRRFVHNSRLRSYLAFKKPASQFMVRDVSTLNEVLQYLKEIISDEKLYDDRNASIVICDRNLEAALDVKALHLMELRDQVGKQLILLQVRGQQQQQQQQTGNRVGIANNSSSGGRTAPQALQTCAAASRLASSARSAATAVQQTNRNRLTESSTQTDDNVVCVIVRQPVVKGGPQTCQIQVPTAQLKLFFGGGATSATATTGGTSTTSATVTTGGTSTKSSNRTGTTSSLIQIAVKFPGTHSETFSDLSSQAVAPAHVSNLSSSFDNSTTKIAAAQTLLDLSKSTSGTSSVSGGTVAASLALLDSSNVANGVGAPVVTSGPLLSVTSPAPGSTTPSPRGTTPNTTPATPSTTPAAPKGVTSTGASADPATPGPHTRTSSWLKNLTGQSLFTVKPFFKLVLNLVEGVRQKQEVFTYTELTNLLSSYIMQNRDRFFDPRNIKVVMCGEDPLGVAFELKAFHRTQVTSLLQSQLIPHLPLLEVKQEPHLQVVKQEPHLQVVKQEPNLQNVKQEPGGNLQDVKQEPKLNAQVKQEEEEDDEDEDEDMEMSEYTEYEIDSEEDGEDAHSSSGDSDFHDVVNDVVHDVAAATTTTAKEEERDDGSGFSADVSDAADLVDLPGQNLQAAPAARKIKCVKCGVFTGTGMLFCARCWREHQEGIPVNSKPMRHLKVREATTDRKAAGPSDPCQKSGEAGPSGLCQESHESGNVASPAADAARTVAVKRLRTGDDCDDDGKRHRLQEQSTLGGDEICTERTAASKEEAKLMCNFCLRREKDGGIVHGGIVHQICCYPCAKRLVKRRQPCPVCRRRIEKISKIIGA